MSAIKNPRDTHFNAGNATEALTDSVPRLAVATSSCQSRSPAHRTEREVHAPISERV